MVILELMGKALFGFLILCAALFAATQQFNCSGVKFCQGKISDLSVWLDRNGNGEIDGDDNKLGIIRAYAGDKSAKDNYNYYSDSAHTIVGPAPAPYESHVFFYQQKGSQDVFLNFHHNVDTAGSPDNIVNWDITTYDNGGLDDVVVSDDPQTPELKKEPTTGNKNLYTARWHYWKNTDGGVIGPFRGTNYKIAVKVVDTNDLKLATFFSADGSKFALSDENNTLKSFIIKFEKENTICF